MITNTAVRQKPVACTSVLAINSPFGRYRLEEERIVRKTEVRDDEVLTQLKGLFREALLRNREFEKAHAVLSPHAVDGKVETHTKNFIKSLLNDVRITSKDVERFSLALAEFQHEDGFYSVPGLFLSRLIEVAKDPGYTLQIRHLGLLLGYLGEQNTKHVTINGDVDGMLGREMAGGTLLVKGNAGDGPGIKMAGGEIRIEGNAGQNAGTQMHGGSILIEGDVLLYLGNWMTSGTIHVKGNAGACPGGWMQGGEIYVNGDAAGLVGHNMSGGAIYIKGNPGPDVGCGMKGGEIHLEGETSYAYYPAYALGIEHGKVYHRGKLIIDK